MIYFDAAATSLQKPPEVAQAVAWAIGNLANPGRSFAPPAMDAARAVYSAREKLARLVGAGDPARVAFTSGCTEAAGLLCRALGPSDHVITTELEHNSILRPLYLAGCQLDVLPADARGNLILSDLPRLIRPETRLVIASLGSNLTGNLTDPKPLLEACRAAKIPLALDAAQALGCSEVALDMADMLLFSGHKALFGPMGVGGLIARAGLELPILKTGGTGADSFSARQPARMPDLAEAGTPNVPGICGLTAALDFIGRAGLGEIIAHDRALTEAFAEGLFAMPGVRVFGDFERWPRLPVVSFEVEGLDSAELSLILWEKSGIVTRPGAHCAPLLHARFGTEARGLVRCSFGWFNTMAEIRAALRAVREARP